MLEARAAEYRSKRRLKQQGLYRSDVAVTKDGHVLRGAADAARIDQKWNEAIVEVTKEVHQVYFHGCCIKLPTKYGGREYYRSVTEDEFVLADPRSGEVVFSFPLPLMALRASGRYINSYAIRGVYLIDPNPYWLRKYDEALALWGERGGDAAEIFTL